MLYNIITFGFNIMYCVYYKPLIYNNLKYLLLFLTNTHTHTFENIHQYNYFFEMQSCLLI